MISRLDTDPTRRLDLYIPVPASTSSVLMRTTDR
jgi:hypothetical protein